MAYPLIRCSKDVCYFLIKSFQVDHIEISQRHGVWATTSRNEKTLSQSFRTHRYVVLVFSVNGSGKFYGYGIMTSEPGKASGAYFGRGGFNGKLFNLEWISKLELPFRLFDNLTNSLNDYKQVKVGRDGQPLSLECGHQLLDIYQQVIEEQNSVGQISVGHSNVKEPSSCGVAGAWMLPETPACDWNSIVLVANPLLAIYPLDLTKFNYTGYLEAYEASQDYLQNNNMPPPPISNYTDWSAQAPEHFMQLLMNSQHKIT
ncbi:YT521-B-like domain protein [Gregarina niphandrodes]|uniref:YT521-B-like domain protein n=1 Tax=Gregarina niphandrodes TaxID=110365 RepID=A0A023B246_GRENI|nr:YT521-B-like domain protein [Gregarina niphandrodes]EZG50653.1 YT521-B-like domain protein [Gregarina niphandrodes]|eukprot:XP_011131998.1 YT521-B-like domain protein [Gregarina niphandrodes]